MAAGVYVTSCTDVRNPFSVSVFEDHVYWTTQEKGEVFRQDKFGRGTKTKLLTTGPWLSQVSVYQQQRYSTVVSKCHTFTHNKYKCNVLNPKYGVIFTIVLGIT